MDILALKDEGFKIADVLRRFNISKRYRPTYLRYFHHRNLYSSNTIEEIVNHLTPSPTHI